MESTLSRRFDRVTQIRSIGAEDAVPTAEDGSRVQSRRSSPTPLEDGNRDVETFYGGRSFQDSTKVHKYSIIRVETPFQFYMVSESDAKKSSAIFKNMDILNKITVAGITVKRPLELTTNQVYIIWHPESDKWHRVRLLDLDHRFGKGRVFFFDHFLGIEYVDLKELMELPNWLEDLPVVTVYRCHLHDVIPIDGSHSWGKKAKNWFIDQIWDTRVWKALVMTWNETVVSLGSHYQQPFTIVDLGVVLFHDNDGECESSLNWRIVEDGYGKCVGVGGAFFQDLCRYTKEPIFPTAEGLRLQVPEYYRNSFPYFAACRLPQVKITFVESSDCVYLQLINKLEDLEAMEYALMHSALTWGNNLNSVEHVCKGLFVICYYNKEVNDFVPTRALVIKVHVKTVEVLLIDSGYLSIVPRDRIYPMPPNLTKIPAFSHRIHLKNIRPAKNDADAWNNNQNSAFMRFIKEIQDEPDTVIFAVRYNHGNDDIVATRTIHQPLVLSLDDNKWTSRQVLQKPSALISNLFYSYGVDLIVSRKNDGTQPPTFESISDLIVADEERFQAQLIRKEPAGINKQEYYSKLIKGFGWLP